MRKLCFILALLGSLPAGAQEVAVHWSLQTGETTVGRTLQLNLTVEGTDQVVLPQLQEPDLQIILAGSQPTRSSSTVSINGRTTSETRTGFQAVWTVKAVRAGRFSLKGYEILLAGRREILPEVTWEVRGPQTSRDFFFRHSLEPAEMVPGLEGIYTLKWYLGETAQDPEFTLPILESGVFQWLEEDQKPGGDAVVLAYGNRTLEGEKSAEILEGRQYTVLTFRLRLRALRAGSPDISGTILNFLGAESYREYYDFFGEKKRQPLFRPLSIPANPLRVTVKDFPAEGKPEPFSGLVGNLEIAWSAAPGTYRVGESIPLSLKVRGLLNGDKLDLDHMVKEAYRDTPFRISDGRPHSEGGRDYSLRVASPGSHFLPGLKLNYFNPQSNSYQWAEAQGIPLSLEGGTPGAMESPSQNWTLGYRALRTESIQGPWPWSLFVLLPLAGGGYFISSWWQTSSLRKRLRNRHHIRRYFSTRLLGSGTKTSPKVQLAEGLRILHQGKELLHSLDAGGGNPEQVKVLETELTSELVVWERAFYSPDLPEWSPAERLQKWSERMIRIIK